MLESIDRLRALPRLAEIMRVLAEHGLQDLVHSSGLHRLADGAAADIQRGREVIFDKPRAGGQLAGEDRLADREVDLAVQRPARRAVDRQRREGQVACVLGHLGHRIGPLILRRLALLSNPILPILSLVGGKRWDRDAAGGEAQRQPQQGRAAAQPARRRLSERARGGAHGRGRRRARQPRRH